ncbi:hypothetical protein OE88DRAFT_1346749 [Heliocybe sulcata]|uniref:Uncharacterized protein n=1 Tax=Heliocybe sulcata TaxID=5364 RepID=A0A5C3N7B2_9AGAM|nr:hypothetical protein OE88DRAFT_1346749 [Heliocybe sulcata]
MEDEPASEEPEARTTNARISIHATSSEMPLLRTESQDSSNNHLLTPNTDSLAGRASLETIEDSFEDGAIVIQPQDTVDIADLPPNYDLAAGNHSPPLDTSNVATVRRNPSGAAGAESEAAGGRRRGLRTLFNAMSHPATRNPHPTSASVPAVPTTRSQQRNSHGHNRDSSFQSIGTIGSGSSHSHSNSNDGLPGTRRPTHRANQSSTGSILGLTSSAFRTISRQRSSNTLNSAHLNSPSTISLHSISAPLAHTLTRTEIVYPRSGPTPEQIKLISSRESLGRFGVPYGPDAIAYAASSSRVNLSLPPPDFDFAIPEGARPQTGDSSGSSGEQGDGQTRRSMSQPRPHAESPDSAASPEANTQEASDSPLSAPVIDAAPATTTVDPEALKAEGIEEKVEERDKEVAPATSTEPETPRNTVVELAESTRAPVPPTSFKPVLGNRSESRASTIQSFATAEESMPPTPSTAGVFVDVEPPTPVASSPATSEPPTPRMAAVHMQEPTDLTITPARHQAVVH